MDKGRLIYRDQSGKLIIILFLITGILLDVVFLFGDESRDGMEILLVTIFFIILPYLMLKSLKNRPGFYEQGVGYFKNNRCTHWVPYHHFNRIECYVWRNDLPKPDKTPTYGIVFYQSDNSFVQISSTSLMQIKENWKAITSNHTYLRTQLKPYEVKSVQEPFNSDKPGIKVTSSDQLLPKTNHPVTKYLHQVLINE